MEAYRSEEEQVEAIKRWFRDNGRSAAIGILLAALVAFAGYSWNQRQVQQQSAASVQFQELLAAVGKLGSEPAQDKDMLATANHLADTLKTDFSGSAYAQLAALFKARLAVQGSDLAGAETELKWVLDHKPSPEVEALTRLRLARVLHAKGDDDAALAQLDKADPGSYAFAYASLRGDIRLAQGDENAARASYEKAKELEGKLSNPLNDPVLQLKLHDLSAGDKAPTPPAKSES